MSVLLVIDRNRRTLHRLCRLFAPHYQIVGVPNLFTGFQLLRRRRFDAIVVKSANHDVYAIAVLKWVAQQKMKCPVVVVLGAGTAGDAAMAREYGASAILRWRPSERSLVRAVAEAAATPPADSTPRQSGAAGVEAARLPSRFRDDHAQHWFRSEHRTQRFG